MGIPALANLLAARGHRQTRRALKKRVLKPLKPSRRNELWYAGQLVGLVQHVRSLVRTQFEQLKPQWPAQARDGIAVDAEKKPPEAPVEPSPEVKAAIEQVRKNTPGLAVWSEKVAREAAAKSAASVDAGVAAGIEAKLGINVGPVLHAYGPLSAPMGTAIRANVQLIKSIQEDLLDRVEETLATAWQEGIGYEQAGKMIEADFELTESRAKLIAKDQTGKMASAFNGERQTQLGIQKYKWRISGHNTRPEHRAMETQVTPYGVGVYRWDEPGPLPGTIDGAPCHPGEDINCNCMAAPVLELDGLELPTPARRAA